MTDAWIDAEFPIDIAYGSTVGPSFNTTITEGAGGTEQRNANWSQGRVRLDAGTGIRSQEELALVHAHFRVAMGRWAGFCARDWSDYTSAFDGVSEPDGLDQLLDAADAEGRRFQLVKRYDMGSLSHVRRITRPRADTLVVHVDGKRQLAGWSLGEKGVILFDVAPGKPVSAGFEFDVPMRYDTDTLSERLEDYLAGSAQIPMVEIRE